VAQLQWGRRAAQEGIAAIVTGEDSRRRIRQITTDVPPHRGPEYAALLQLRSSPVAALHCVRASADNANRISRLPRIPIPPGTNGRRRHRTTGELTRGRELLAVTCGERLPIPAPDRPSRAALATMRTLHGPVPHE